MCSQFLRAVSYAFLIFVAAGCTSAVENDAISILSPAVNPDGTYIAFSFSDEVTYNHRIGIVSTDVLQNPTLFDLSLPPSLHWYSPIWAKDSKSLYLLSYCESDMCYQGIQGYAVWQVNLLNPDTDKNLILVTQRKQDRSAGDISLGPNGDILIVEQKTFKVTGVAAEAINGNDLPGGFYIVRYSPETRQERILSGPQSYQQYLRQKKLSHHFRLLVLPQYLQNEQIIAIGMHGYNAPESARHETSFAGDDSDTFLYTLKDGKYHFLGIMANSLTSNTTGNRFLLQGSYPNGVILQTVSSIDSNNQASSIFTIDEGIVAADLSVSRNQNVFAVKTRRRGGAWDIAIFKAGAYEHIRLDMQNRLADLITNRRTEEAD